MKRSTITTAEVQHLIEQKLDAFERLEPEFKASFQFLQDVHGQKRRLLFPVADVVRYLHARWVCECRAYLLSVAKTVKEYEGLYCLELLRHWQEGDTASVVEFLYHKLDMLPLADITRQLHEARMRHFDEDFIQRLVHGRMVMLNRGMNLMHALDSIFALSEEDLQREVQIACEQYGHLPAQIEQQVQAMDSPLFAYLPHQALAQRNMRVMNELGIDVTTNPADRPGKRSWRVLPPMEPLGPYAEQVIKGYQELISPIHNNLKDDRFVDRPEQSDAGTM